MTPLPRRQRLPVSLCFGLLLSGWAVGAFAQDTTQPGQAPLQGQVDAARKPVAGDPAAAGLALKMDNGEAPQPNPDPRPPLDSLASVGSDYRIGASDLMEFDVFGVPDMKRDVRVNSSGNVSLPLIGSVPLVGLTAQQAEALIAMRYAEKYLQDPQVSLFIKEFTTQRITIEGAVVKPGIYPVTGQLTLLRALALAGGGGQYAELREIMLFRASATGPREPQVFDLDRVRNGEVPDPIIQSDDVIVVKRNATRTTLRDSVFSDLINTLNPFR